MLSLSLHLVVVIESAKRKWIKSDKEERERKKWWWRWKSLMSKIKKITLLFRFYMTKASTKRRERETVEENFMRISFIYGSLFQSIYIHRGDFLSFFLSACHQCWLSATKRRRRSIKNSVLLNSMPLNHELGAKAHPNLYEIYDFRWKRRKYHSNQRESTAMAIWISNQRWSHSEKLHYKARVQNAEAWNIKMPRFSI